MQTPLKNKKIALFMLPLLTQGGGAEKYFINLARNLSERGIHADVITMNEAFFNKFVRLQQIIVFGNFFGSLDISGREKEEDVIRNLGKSKWIKSSFRNLKKTLQEYDIIYSKNEIVDLALLKLNGYNNLPPVIIGVHTPLYYPIAETFIAKCHNSLYLGSIYRWLIKGAACIHLSNKFQKNLVVQKFRIKTELIYYPFSIKEIRKAALENDSGIKFSENKINIAIVSRLSEQKGIRSLVNIVQQISKNKKITSKIQINIFGVANKDEKKMVNNLENNLDFVKYFGYIENKFIPRILNFHDLFLTTSYWETLPFNVLEAQAMGIPVISFDIPGPSDIIIDGKTGFLVKNEIDFCKKIEQFVREEHIFKKKDIIENIEDKFNPEKIYLEICSMIEKHL